MPRSLAVLVPLLWLLAASAVTAQPGALGPQGRNFYWQGGPVPVRIYDGGTGARDAFTARRNLGAACTNCTETIYSNWTFAGSLGLPYTLATDSTFFIRNYADTTKKAKFSTQLISAGTTRRYRLPDASGELALLDRPTAQTFSGTNNFLGAINFGGPSIAFSQPQQSSDAAWFYFGDDDGGGSIKMKGPPALAGLTSDYDVRWQAAAGTIPLLEATQTWTAPQEWTATQTTNSAAGGAIVVTDDMSNGNPAITFIDTNTGSSAYICMPPGGTGDITHDHYLYMQDASGTLAYIETSPFIGASVNLTAQAANIGTTALLTAPAAGMYRVTAYLEGTTVGTGTLTVTIGWSDDVGATTDANLTLSLLGTGRASRTVLPYITSGNLTYAVSGYLTGAYALRIRVESLK